MTEYIGIYQGCFRQGISHDKCCLSWQAFDIDQGYVSGEAYLPSSGSELKLLNTFEFIKAVSDKAVSDTVFDMINAVLSWQAFDLIGAICLSLSSFFWHCIRHHKCCLLWQAFDIIIHDQRRSLLIFISASRKTKGLSW